MNLTKNPVCNTTAKEVTPLYKEVFKTRIKQIRKELGLTQAQVANETEIPRSNISKYESGDLEPTLEQLGRLAQYFCVSTDWLLGVTHKFSYIGELPQKRISMISERRSKKDDPPPPKAAK